MGRTLVWSEFFKCNAKLRVIMFLPGGNGVEPNDILE